MPTGQPMRLGESIRFILRFKYGKSGQQQKANGVSCNSVKKSGAN
jgi:hypothetical protein